MSCRLTIKTQDSTDIRATCHVRSPVIMDDAIGKVATAHVPLVITVKNVTKFAQDSHMVATAVMFVNVRKNIRKVAKQRYLDQGDG